MKSHSRSRQSILLLALVVSCVCSLDPASSMIPKIQFLPSTVGGRTRTNTLLSSSILSLRGGESATKVDGTTSTASKSKGKKSKSKKKKTKKATEVEEDPASDDEATAEEDVSEYTSTSSSKQAINNAMKEKDAAEALGDAIR